MFVYFLDLRTTNHLISHQNLQVEFLVIGPISTYFVFQMWQICGRGFSRYEPRQLLTASIPAPSAHTAESSAVMSDLKSLEGHSTFRHVADFMTDLKAEGE